MIELKNISKVYDTKSGPLTAVKNVNLSIEDGDIFGVVGFSGAGKSTLIRLLNGLELPTTGTVKVNNQAINNLSAKSLRLARRDIGMIFQHFNLLWSRTVIENIELPLELTKLSKSLRRKRALELIELVGLNGREDAYPAELSGGQKQRVGIARALANNPKLLLCDEATSALDPQTTDEVLDLLLDINHKLKITMVVITHEMHVVRKICKNMAVMDTGEIVEKGQVFDIFRHPQADITKNFVQAEVTPELKDTHVVLEELLQQVPDGLIVELFFHGDQAKLPIISELLRQFPQLDLNIIEGSIHRTQAGSLGNLFVQIQGDSKDIDAAIELLNKMRVETEVIRHG